MNSILTGAIVVVALLAIAALLATQHGPLARLMTALLRIPETAIVTVREALDAVSTWLSHSVHLLLRRVTPSGSTTWVGHSVIAMTMVTACTLVVTAAELILLELTYPLVSFGFEVGTVSANLTRLVAASTIAMTVVWAVVFAETTGMATYSELGARAQASPKTRYGYLLLTTVAAAGLAYLLYQLALVRAYEADTSSSSLALMQAADPFALDAAVPPPAAPPPGEITDAQVSAGKRYAHQVLMFLGALTAFVGKWYYLPWITAAGAMLLSLLWLLVAPLRLIVTLVDRLMAVVIDELAPAALDLTHHVAGNTKNYMSAHLRAAPAAPELDELIRTGDQIAAELGERVLNAAASNGHVHQAADDPSNQTGGERHA